jgi:ribosomal protein S18 acetylase RimI-like enzyme
MDDDLNIRLATSGDADAIASLSRTEIEHDLSWGWTPIRVDRAIVDANTNVAVAFEGGPLAGFGIMEYQDEVAHLQLFAVRPGLRRRGVGSAILLWLEKVASESGLVCFRVEARQDNLPALAFYRRHGYRERATVLGMYEGFEDGIRLEKTTVAEGGSYG